MSKLLPGILLALSLSSCVFVVSDDGDVSLWHNGVRGSGVRAEADRSTEEFHAIVLETCATVVVKVGEPTSIHLATDDNLLERVETKVSNGVLTIDTRGSCSFRSGLELVIGTPSLERFGIEGSGDVQIQGLAADEVKLAIEGSGTLHARGSARKVVGSIEGSGNLALAELASASAVLSIEGSGAIEAHVAEELRYSIEGSGSIRYAGAARVDGDIDGSGSVERTH